MSNLILHIPHASLSIPDYSAFLLPRDAVDVEALHLSDLYTDELFLPLPGDVVIQANFSRVYCDVERFKSDSLEPMSKFGMGATYLRCDDGRELRRLSSKQREQILQNFYEPHHDQLTNAVDIALSTVGEASIMDCHSYPNTPLQCSLYRGDAQFDFNIGTDEFHTPQDWIDASVQFFADRGFRLGIDEPYAGSIVPIKHYHQNRHVKSMMLEINRRLYLDDSYSRGPHFSEIQRVVSDFLSMIRVLR
jgi:N-formylglutamate amidohydrolase